MIRTPVNLSHVGLAAVLLAVGCTDAEQALDELNAKVRGTIDKVEVTLTYGGTAAPECKHEQFYRCLDEHGTDDSGVKVPGPVYWEYAFDKGKWITYCQANCKACRTTKVQGLKNIPESEVPPRTRKLWRR